jgi:hypothetical protein
MRSSAAGPDRTVDRSSAPTPEAASSMLATSYGRDLWSEADINLRDSDICYGSFASVWPDHDDFRSTPVNGHSQDRRACLRC